MSFFARIVLDRGNGIVDGSLWVWGVGSGGCCPLYDGSLFFMLFTCSNTRGNSEASWTLRNQEFGEGWGHNGWKSGSRRSWDNKADAYPRCGLTTPARLTGFPASTSLPSQALSLAAAKTERIWASGPIQTRDRETRPRETDPFLGQHASLGGPIALDLSGSVPNDPSHDLATRTDGGQRETQQHSRTAAAS